jgi:hypothetical protein
VIHRSKSAQNIRLKCFLAANRNAQGAAKVCWFESSGSKFSLMRFRTVIAKGKLGTFYAALARLTIEQIKMSLRLNAVFFNSKLRAQGKAPSANIQPPEKFQTPNNYFPRNFI